MYSRNSEKRSPVDQLRIRCSHGDGELILIIVLAVLSFIAFNWYQAYKVEQSYHNPSSLIGKTFKLRTSKSNITGNLHYSIACSTNTKDLVSYLIDLKAARNSHGNNAAGDIMAALDQDVQQRLRRYDGRVVSIDDQYGEKTQPIITVLAADANAPEFPLIKAKFLNTTNAGSIWWIGAWTIDFESK